MSTSVHELNEIANTGHGGRLGLTVTDYDSSSGTLSASWMLIPNVRDQAGNVHHGAISAVVETIASIGAGAIVDGDQTVVGVSNSTDVVRPTRRSPLVATGVPISRDERQQLWEVRVVDGDDELVARGTVRLQHLDN